MSMESCSIPASMRSAPLNLRNVLVPLNHHNLRVAVLIREAQKRFWKSSHTQSSEDEDDGPGVQGSVQEWDMSAWHNAMNQLWSSLS